MANRLDAVYDVSADLISACKILPWLDLNRFELAITEALNNAVVHGTDPDRDECIQVHADIREETVTVTIRDPLGRLDPQMLSNNNQPAAEDVSSGRGLFIIQSLSQAVNINEGSLIITFSNAP